MLLFDNLDRIDESVVGDRNKCEVYLAQRRSWYVVEDPHHSPVGNASRLPQNVEVLQERGSVAIDVENAAAYPAIRIRRRKPCFRKIQNNGVPSVFDDRD